MCYRLHCGVPSEVICRAKQISLHETVLERHRRGCDYSVLRCVDFPKRCRRAFHGSTCFQNFRIVKMSRHNTKVREAGSSLLASLSELSFVFVVLITLVILFSTIIYYAEMGDEDTKFTSIPATFWYVIVTMTTLG